MSPHLRCLLSALFLFPLAAHGTLVTTATDEDDGSLGGGTGVSLREAVKYSPAGDTITFAPILSGQTIRLTLGQIVILGSITIDASSLPDKISLSGDKTGDGKTADDTRVINITTGVVVLDSLVITGGNCPAGTTNTKGGGIYVNFSPAALLTVRNSLFTSNYAVSGGAIYHYGLLNSPDPSIHIQNCTFTGNTSTEGGAIYGRDSTATIESSRFTGNSATSSGGAIWTRFNLLLTTSTLAGNTAPLGGGIYHYTNTCVIERSTLSGNTATSYGGGGVFNDPFSESLTIRNSTITGNTATGASSGGGIYSDHSTLIVQSSTVSGNTANTSAGITSTSFQLSNSIVAGNVGLSPDTSGTYTGSNNITSGNPHLAPLGDYGGPTQTMPPLTTSPAIDAGGSTTLTTDQRGLPRDAKPDIGAAEYQGTRNLAAPILDSAGDATLSFGTPANIPGFAWVLSRSPDLTPGSFMEIYRYQGGSDIAAPGTTFVRTAAFITVTDGNAPAGSGFYRIGLVPVP